MGDIDQKFTAIKHLQDMIEAIKSDKIVVDTIHTETQLNRSVFNGLFVAFEPSNKFVETIVYHQVS